MKEKNNCLLLFQTRRSYLMEELTEELNKTAAQVEALFNVFVGKNILRYKNNKYQLRKNLTIGKINIIKRDSYLGFVDDIAVDKRKLKTALDGDIVLIERKKAFNYPYFASVVEVLKRNKEEYLCEVKKVKNKTFLVVKEELRLPIKVNNYDNHLDGDIVKVKVVNYYKNYLEAEIVSYVGHVTDPDIEILMIIASHDFPLKDSPEALKEADNLSDLIETEGRLVLKEDDIITIDGADAKDLDDAISLKKAAGFYYLNIHIADVSHYVRAGSELDKSAFNKATSAYLADRVIPMLPRRLANDLCSLTENKARYGFSLLIKLSEDAKIVDYQIKETVIVVKKRLTYQEVNDFFANKGRLSPQYEKMLTNMKELSEKLSVLRKRAGMIEFKSKEYQYLLNDKNEIIEIKLKKSGASEKIIENFMILANEIVGSHFFNLSLPAIYRVHEKPDLEKINNLFLELNKLKIKTPRINHLTPLALQSFLEEVKDHPLSDYINDLLLKSMAKAKYSEINKGHYGLALNNYSHFTAPIRRYSDLFLHRLIKELILYPRELNKKINNYQTILKAICQQASLMEVKAETISREVDKYMVTKYMQNFLNEEFEGVITGMIKSGIFVTVKDGIEGFIPFRLLNSYYAFDEKTLTAINETTKKTYQLSNQISVKLVEVNVSLRQITFVLVDK